jgi:predicted nucleic-acid-binding protein
MYIIDTSVYCSIFLEDVHAEEAIDMISSISEKIYVPHMIFAETLTVLTYKYSKERA